MTENTQPPVNPESPTPPPAGLPVVPKPERTWGMLCHLAGVAGFIIPLVGFILGPLVVWLLKREEYTFVDDQGKEAVNFQVSITIYMIVSIVLVFFLTGFFLLLLAVAIFNIAMMIKAMIRSSDGQRFRYPLTIRIVK